MTSLTMTAFGVRKPSHSGLWQAGAALVLAVIILGATACGSPTSVSIRDLCILPSDQFGVMNAEQVAKWIQDNYQASPNFVERTEDNDKILLYSWVSGTTILDAELRRNTLFRFSRAEMQQGPKLSQIIAGVGPPEAIHSTSRREFEGLQYALFLEYPSQGISVGVVRIARNEEIRNNAALEIHLRPEMQVTHIHCYTPRSSLDELLRTVYETPPESLETEKRKFKPWPGFGAWVPLR